MSLQEITEKRIQEAIAAFHYYAKEISIDYAKKRTLETTCLKAVIKYVEDYEA